MSILAFSARRNTYNSLVENGQGGCTYQEPTKHNKLHDMYLQLSKFNQITSVITGIQNVIKKKRSPCFGHMKRMQEQGHQESH
jgi:hypothetical protein